jgi:hypothetical protein
LGSLGKPAALLARDAAKAAGAKNAVAAIFLRIRRLVTPLLNRDSPASRKHYIAAPNMQFME